MFEDGKRRPDGLGVEPSLHDLDALVQRLDVIIGEHRYGLLSEDDALVDRELRDVHRAASYLHAGLERLCDRVPPLERRKERGMGVEHAAGIGRMHLLAENRPEACHRDKIDGELRQRLNDLVRVGPAVELPREVVADDGSKRNPCALSDLLRRTVSIDEDHPNRKIRDKQRLQQASCSRSKHRDSHLSTLPAPSSAPRGCGRSRRPHARRRLERRRSSDEIDPQLMVACSSAIQTERSRPVFADVRLCADSRQVPDDLDHSRSGLSGILGDDDACCLERRDLALRGADVSRDDRARVSHLPALWSGVACDELRSALFRVTTDLTDHQDRSSLRVLLECREAVNEVRARDRVSTDADARRLTDALLGQLEDRLVKDRSRPRDKTDRSSCQRDVTRGDANVRLASRDDAGAVWAEQASVREVPLQRRVDACLILGGDELGDADDEGNTSLRSLENRRWRTRRRNSDKGRIRTGRGDRFSDVAEDGDSLYHLARSPRIRPCHHLRAISAISQRVIQALARRAHTLHNYLGRLVNEDAHLAPPAISTAFFAASSIVG